LSTIRGMQCYGLKQQESICLLQANNISYAHG